MEHSFLDGTRYRVTHRGNWVRTTPRGYILRKIAKQKRKAARRAAQRKAG